MSRAQLGDLVEPRKHRRSIALIARLTEGDAWRALGFAQPPRTAPANPSGLPRLRHESRRVAADTKLGRPFVDSTKMLREPLDQFSLVPMAFRRVVLWGGLPAAQSTEIGEVTETRSLILEMASAREQSIVPCASQSPKSSPCLPILRFLRAVRRRRFAAPNLPRLCFARAKKGAKSSALRRCVALWVAGATHGKTLCRRCFGSPVGLSVFFTVRR